MAQFHQHSDGAIYVRSGANVYGDTSANFATDSGATAPALPAGVAERLYDDDPAHGRHVYCDAKGNQLDASPGPGAWAPGDAIIANCTALIGAQQARIAAALAARQPEPPEAPAIGTTTF
jgi:hypothetical protein